MRQARRRRPLGARSGQAAQFEQRAGHPVGRMAQHIHRTHSVRIDAGGIGDEADPLALKLGKVVSFQYVDAELHRGCGQGTK